MVAPLWVRGLKQTELKEAENATGRTLVGAWIETLFYGVVVTR